jgi:hypothetical protein
MRSISARSRRYGRSFINPEPESQPTMAPGWIVRAHPTHSGCMFPALQPQDRIAVVYGKNYRLGEIILFRRGRNLILHRVVAIFPGKIRTKGDVSPQLDPPLAIQDILGRAIFLERDGKIHDLDSFRDRWLGLAYSLAVFLASPLAPYLPAAVRNWAKEKPRLLFP